MKEVTWLEPRLHLGGTPFSVVLCGSLLCLLRSSSLLSFFPGHICSELWELVFLRVGAIFATCFLLMGDLWEIKDCFKDLRIQGFLKARLMVSLAIKFPQNLLAFKSVCFWSALCVCFPIHGFYPYICFLKLLWFFASSNPCLSPLVLWQPPETICIRWKAILIIIFLFLVESV